MTAAVPAPLRAVTIAIPDALLIEAIARAAQAEIAARIGELSLDELGARWRCTNRKETLRKCRERGVPVHRERGRKEAYVLLADAEAAHARLRAAAQLLETRDADGGAVRLVTFTAPRAHAA